MTLTPTDISQGVQALGMSGTPVCVHSSLRSFGPLDRGPSAVVEGLLAEHCTLLVPSFSSEAYEVAPPPGVSILRNAMEVEVPTGPTPGSGRAYTSTATEIDSDMGAIPRTVANTPGRARSAHPIRSFSAVGPQASELASEKDAELFGPLMKLAGAGGAVLLMGVGLDKITAIHLAEQLSGRNMFVRWANGPDLKPRAVEVGGCSNGFPGLTDVLSPIEKQTTVGGSMWRVFPAQQILDIATQAIRRAPEVTHCAKNCVRCDSAVLGGPTPA